MHAECGLDNRDITQYTDQEILRLKVGWLHKQSGRRDAMADRDLPKGKQYSRQKAREWARKRN